MSKPNNIKHGNNGRLRYFNLNIGVLDATVAAVSFVMDYVRFYIEISTSRMKIGNILLLLTVETPVLMNIEVRVFSNWNIGFKEYCIWSIGLYCWLGIGVGD